MCLARVTKQHNRPLRTERVAYKIIERRGPVFKTPYLCAEITPDVWMTASITTIETLKDKNGVRHKYHSGFHVFTTRRGAQALLQDSMSRANMYVVKVRVRGIMCEGKDGTCGSGGATSRFGNLVVQEMQVPSSELNEVWKMIAKAGGF